VFVRLVKLWIWISALASLAGWLLSALGMLNKVGYGIFAAVVVVAVLVLGKRPLFSSPVPALRGWRHRIRRFLPASFVVLAALIFAGGIIYPPTNYTGLAYHIPRVLHWLAEQRWHWIHTPVARMNYPGCNFEWMTAPLLLFTGSDRALFLLNFIPFLFLPGLIFSVFIRLGVRPRVAWQWMWLLPTGYTFLLQAGSVGNDAVSAFYALAAVEFACRARVSRRSSDIGYSILAAALLTGIKPTSLPLLLLWGILILPCVGELRRAWLSNLLTLALALTVSFFPTALMNRLHAGDWLGASVEPDHVDIHRPVDGVLGNGFQLIQANLAPPVFPPAGAWNHYVESHVPQQWLKEFQGGTFAIGELPTEDWAGVGMGISLLVIALLIGSFSRGRSGKPGEGFRPTTPNLPRWVLIAPWFSLLVYCVKAGMSTSARLIAPYYPLMLPLLLTGRNSTQIVRRTWWRVLVAIVIFLAFVVLAISPDRPLWPAKTVLSHLAAQHPESRSLARARNVYTTYSGRNDPLADVRKLLPPDAKTVGFIGSADDVDISFWQPYGTRRVEHFLLTDSPEQIRQKVKYVVLGGYNLNYNHLTLDAWLQQNGAELVGATNATLKVSEGVQPWYVVRFK
jgi:hypothetical protein